MSETSPSIEGLQRANRRWKIVAFTSWAVLALALVAAVAVNLQLKGEAERHRQDAERLRQEAKAQQERAQQVVEQALKEAEELLEKAKEGKRKAQQQNAAAALPASRSTTCTRPALRLMRPNASSYDAPRHCLRRPMPPSSWAP